jgi:hypothetical protein
MLGLDNGFDLAELLAGQADVPGQLNLWLQPELRLAVSAGNVDVHARLFTG